MRDKNCYMDDTEKKSYTATKTRQNILFSRIVRQTTPNEMRHMNQPLRFIDLFAGLGGFHLALKQLGHQCVFACELADNLRSLYHRNFGHFPEGDIRRIELSSIPEHDLLCAGFPCQPFSKAGEQQGLSCPNQGDLFDYVAKILEIRKPSLFILENVPNLLKHNQGKTYQYIKDRLHKLGYEVKEERLSPHQFGIPQIRERVYIIGSLVGLANFSWPKQNTFPSVDISSKLDFYPKDAKPISSQIVECIATWQKFIEAFPKNEELPSFPIWSMEFGADYPFEKKTPFSIGTRALRKYRGTHGIELATIPPAERMNKLPPYAKNEELTFPSWKIDFIKKNRDLYQRHRNWLDQWMPSILKFPPSYQKFEWNCKGSEKRCLEACPTTKSFRTSSKTQNYFSLACCNDR